MAQYFVGLPLKYFGIRGEALLVLHHWAGQKFRWRLNQCFLKKSYAVIGIIPFVFGTRGQKTNRYRAC